MKISKGVSTIVLIGSLVLGPAIGPVFAANKAGGACSKAGATAKVSKTTLTCKKVGKKLVWVSGAAAVVVEDLGKDPSISPVSALSSADVCKITDITQGPNNEITDASSGFPRYTLLPPATRNARVLILPVSFSDFKFTDTTYDTIKLAYQSIVKYYSSMSYGRVTVAPTFAPKSDWITLSSTIGENGLQDGEGADVVVRRLLALYATTHSFANYDIVDLVTNNDASSQLQINLAMPADTSGYGTNQPVAATLNAGLVGRFRHHAHEIGHAWLGYEDLYRYEDLEKFFGGWDLMDSAAGTNELSSWSRWLAGWVTDAQVRCINAPGTTTHFVSALSTVVSTPKMIVTKLSNSSALVVELRTPTEFDTCEVTAVVYVVDTKYWSGAGPIRLRGTLTSAGGVITTDGVTVTLGKMNSAGAVITVAKS